MSTANDLIDRATNVAEDAITTMKKERESSRATILNILGAVKKYIESDLEFMEYLERQIDVKTMPMDVQKRLNTKRKHAKNTLKIVEGMIRGMKYVEGI
jgi:hypothetical protein